MSVPANSLDITQAGLVKFDGSANFTGVTVTQYDVLVGSSSNGITSVTPSTSGKVLTSNGVSVDPSFETISNANLPGSGQITLSNGTNVSVTGSPVALGGTATINVSGPPSATTLTSNGVVYGQGTSAIAATAAGLTNRVLLGNTGSAPSFGTVPNAALTNSAITLTSGTGITVTGSPVSLGGTATIALTVPVAIANGGTNATSMATSTGIVKYDGTRLVTSSTAKISAANIYTNTSQPILYAKLNTGLTNATGDGTALTPLIFDTVVYQQGSNYNTGTGNFTCPVTGSYLVTTAVTFNNLGALHTRGQVQIVNGDGSHNVIITEASPGACRSSANYYTMVITSILVLTAADTINIHCFVGGSTKTVGVQGENFGTFTTLNIALLS